MKKEPIIVNVYLWGTCIGKIVSASYHGASGDSGGIVYTALGTYGIHEGGTGTISYFIKASLINNAFGLTRY